MALFDKAFTHGHPVKIGHKIYHVWASYKKRVDAAQDAGDARERGHLARVIKRGDRWLVALRRK